MTVPTEIPEVVVYVDQFGHPLSTATETVLYVPATIGSSTPYPTTSPTPTPSAADPVSSSGSDDNLHGITYSPYQGTGHCKSASEVNADFAVFGPNYGVVRLYGVDCDQVASAYVAAKKYGNKLFLGIFDIDSVDSAIATIAAGINNDWSIVDTISVGNELVNSGAMSPDAIIAVVTQARKALRDSGYQGPVVTVDTFVAVINHPEICNESDYCAISVHPFFDPNISPDQAGLFISTQIERVRAQLSDPSKRVVVAETGWPWKGNPNGQAVPSMNNQAIAISSIMSSFSENPADFILFTAFNDLWKKSDADTFFAEQYWGVGGRFSASDS